MKVRYSPQAGNDLRDIFQYLHDRSPSGAENVMRAIYAGIEFLAETQWRRRKRVCRDSRKDRASVQFQDLLKD
jgi:plasmid stabilization system protein ParE